MGNTNQNSSIKNKNPIAQKIGKRMAMARKSNGFKTGDKLLEALPSWSRGRLGNYESGISIPSPDVLLQFCNVVNVSPCWIMFGIGSVKENKLDIQTFRQQNLVQIVKTITNIREITLLLKHLGISQETLDAKLANPFSKISDRIARKTESFFYKPRGWMDMQRFENMPFSMTLPHDMRELMYIFSELSETKRKKLLGVAREMKL